MLFEIGRVCVKIAGREAGRKCVIVDKKDKFVLIDGNVRRKLCNPAHLEPMDIVLKIKKEATTSEVKSAMKKAKLKVIEKKKKKREKEKLEKPRRKRKIKVKEVKEEPKKETKKTTKKKNEKPKK